MAPSRCFDQRLDPGRKIVVDSVVVFGLRLLAPLGQVMLLVACVLAVGGVDGHGHVGLHEGAGREDLKAG